MVVEWVVIDLFSHDACKTANVNHRHINKKQNSKYKIKKLKAYNGVKGRLYI